MAIGFTINEDKAAAARAEAPASGEEITTEEELCLAVVAQLRQNHPKAALAAAVNLTNRIVEMHGLTGGAWL